jgi:hypothetical protein
VARDHDVQLLVTARLVVVLDQLLAAVRGVGVDPERGDPERAADRSPVDAGDGDLLQFVDVEDSRYANTLRIRSSTRIPDRRSRGHDGACVAHTQVGVRYAEEMSIVFLTRTPAVVAIPGSVRRRRGSEGRPVAGRGRLG